MRFEASDIQALASRYHQLLLPVREGISKSEEYRGAVLRGIIPSGNSACLNHADISMLTVNTPAGKAEIILASDREEFIHLYQSLAYRCEPVEIPASVGATIISGLINWEKINRHKADYLGQGKTDWGEEFKRFTADKNNYCDSLILISKGPYSAVPAAWVQMTDQQWKDSSVVIRIYHELTHFVCRKLYPGKKDALRDEVYADCIGLIAAFGEYDISRARMFFGIESETYRKGGRLEHYSPDCSEEIIRGVDEWILEAENRVAAEWDRKIWNDLSEQERDGALFGLLTKIY